MRNADGASHIHGINDADGASGINSMNGAEGASGINSMCNAYGTSNVNEMNGTDGMSSINAVNDVAADMSHMKDMRDMDAECGTSGTRAANDTRGIEYSHNNMDGSRTLSVAAIVTEYRYNSHAEMIVGRLFGEMGYEPRVRVVSLYTDQVPANDASREAAASRGVPICATIREAVRAEHRPEPIDGVILIAEHGSYPINEKEQMMYPRRRFLEETLAALDELGLAVPIFTDKHLAWNYPDALWMFEQTRRRGIPLFGGSSIPHCDAVPAYDPDAARSLREIVVVSAGGLEGYGIHAMEVLQSVAERREGGETGVRAITLLRGTNGETWAAMDRGEWPEELLLAALRTIPGIPDAHPRELEPEPALFAIEYADGARGFIIQFRGLTEYWSYAFRDAGGRVTAARCDSDQDRPFRHFERLTRMIETFVETGREPIAPERLLLTTGMICAAMDSLHAGERLETPQLAIAYQARTDTTRTEGQAK